MKKSLIIFYLILWCMNSRSQSTYSPFPSNMIIYGWSETYYASSGTVLDRWRSEITGDTLIGAFHYSKLYSGTNSFEVTAAIRNDTLNKKVYMYSIFTGTESLMYDFNLVVGDTVNINNGYGFYQPLVETWLGAPEIKKAWVTSIDSVLMLHDGIYHRRYNFSATIRDINSASPDVVINSASIGPYQYSQIGVPDMYYMMNPLIEGVGQIRDPVSHYFFFEQQWRFSLFCVSVNGSPVMNIDPTSCPPFNTALCSSVFTGIDEIKNTEDIGVFPNPNNGKFQLKLMNQKSVTLEITDILGNTILKSEIKNETIDFDLSGQSDGIYFVKTIDSKGSFVVKKIVKQ